MAKGRSVQLVRRVQNCDFLCMPDRLVVCRNIQSLLAEVVCVNFVLLSLLSVYNELRRGFLYKIAEIAFHARRFYLLHPSLK